MCPLSDCFCPAFTSVLSVDLDFRHVVCCAGHKYEFFPVRGVRSGEMLDLSRESGDPMAVLVWKHTLCCTAQFVLYWCETTLYYVVLQSTTGLQKGTTVFCTTCTPWHNWCENAVEPSQTVRRVKTRARCTEIRAGCGENMNEWKQVGYECEQSGSAKEHPDLCPISNQELFFKFVAANEKGLSPRSFDQDTLEHK